MSSIYEITMNEMLTSQIVVPIISDGVFSFHLFNTQERCQKIQNTIVGYVSDNLNTLVNLSYNSYGVKFSTAEDYVNDEGNPTVYGANCELFAADNIFPYVFEIYYNHNAKIGVDTFPVKSKFASNVAKVLKKMQAHSLG